jgi:PelA/Pel-15E family pectate lyase
MKTMRIALLSVALAMLLVSTPADVHAQMTVTAARKHLDQPPEWYRGEEAKRIAGVVLSYQADDGGWPKNTDTGSKPYEGSREELKSTFDNSATTDELRFMARMATHAPQDKRYAESFNKGLDLILKAQYANGGWPQYFPPGDKYNKHITYNDGCMVRLMFFVREVSSDDTHYGFVDGSKRKACAAAWDKGIDCILKTQVKVDGKLTSWCAQHDEVTFEPQPARTFEPKSLSACETIGILHALMAVENPSPAIVQSVDACAAWLEAVKIPGIKVEDRKQEGTPRGYDRFVVKDETAPPMWVRFYEIGTNRPIFAGRDAVVKYDLSEIEIERRTGYKWLAYWPKNLLEKEYPEWKAKVAGKTSPTAAAAK